MSRAPKANVYCTIVAKQHTVLLCLIFINAKDILFPVFYGAETDTEVMRSPKQEFRTTDLD